MADEKSSTPTRKLSVLHDLLERLQNEYLSPQPLKAGAGKREELIAFNDEFNAIIGRVTALSHKANRHGVRSRSDAAK